MTQSDIALSSSQPYLHLGDDAAGGGVLQPLVPPRVKGEGPTGWSPNRTVQQAMVSLLSSAEGMGALLGVPFALRTLADGDAATQVPLPQGLELVITEYHLVTASMYSNQQVPAGLCRSIRQ